MYYFYIVLLLISSTAFLDAALNDELPQCGLVGIYKTRQTVLQSPNYPQPYPPSTCWDYVVRSPYRCPTKFHIQFLDFSLETSQNCSNDYLAIGLNNVGDNLEQLCGQFVGIKKYPTSDGVLRLRFYTDNSPLTTGKGFKLIVTRLACEDSNTLRELYADETLQPSNSLENIPKGNTIGNYSLLKQYQLPPYPNLVYYPASQIPCPTDIPLQAELAPAIVRSGEEVAARQHISINVCCQSSFSQQHFYLSSPGFPRTAITSLLPAQRRDCHFEMQKFSQSVCRLRIEFRFFDFGQPYAANAPNACAEDFLEIEGIRYCGCHTGFVGILPWSDNSKFLHMRMGFSGLASNGFLLNIKQELCQDYNVLQPNYNFGRQSNIIAEVPVRAFYSVQQQQLPNYYANQLQPRWPAYSSLYRPYRQARRAQYVSLETAAQPFAVLETNSTSKEFYYADAEQPKAQERSDKLLLEPRNSCSFGSANIFQLLVDPLWLRKPTCIAPIT